MYRFIYILFLVPLVWAYNIGDSATVQYNGSPSRFNFTLDASTQARFQFTQITGTQFYISFTSGSSYPAGLYIPAGSSSFMFDTRSAGCPLLPRNIQLYIEGAAGTSGSLSFTSSLITPTLSTGTTSLTVPSGDSLASPAKFVVPAQSCQTIYMVVEGAVPSLTLDCGQDISAYAANGACSGSTTTFSSSFIATANGTGLTGLTVNCGPSGNYVLNLLTISAVTTVDYATTYQCQQSCADNGGLCYRGACVCPASFQSGSNCEVIDYTTQSINQAFYYQDGEYVKINIPSSVSSQSILTISYTSGNVDSFVYIRDNAPATVGDKPSESAVALTLKAGQTDTLTSACFSSGLSGFITAYFQAGSRGTVTFATAPATPQITAGDNVYTSTGTPIYLRYTVQSAASNTVVTLSNNSAVSLVQQDAYTSPSVFSLSTFATDNACAPASSTASSAFAFVNGNIVYQAIDYDSTYVYLLVTAEAGTRFTINIAENPTFCPQACNDNGVCVQGSCVCSEYYSGTSCDTEEPVFDPQQFPLAATTFMGTRAVSFRTRVPAGTLPALDIDSNTPIELSFSDDASSLDENIDITTPFSGFVYSNECPTSRGDSFYSLDFVAPISSNPSYTITPYFINVTLAEGDNQYSFKTSKDVRDYTYSHAFFQGTSCTPGEGFTITVSSASLVNEVRVLYNVDQGCNSYTALLAQSDDNDNTFTTTIPATLGCLPFIVIVDVSVETVPSSIQYTVNVASKPTCGSCFNGNCVDSVCVCNDGFYGADCSQSNLACLQPTTLSKCKAYVTYPFSYAGSLTPSCSAESLLIPDYSLYNNISSQCIDAATKVSCQSSLYPCKATTGAATTTTKYAGPDYSSCSSLVSSCGNLYSSQLSRVAALGDVYSLCGVKPIGPNGGTIVLPTPPPVTISPTVTPTATPEPRPSSADRKSVV